MPPDADLGALSQEVAQRRAARRWSYDDLAEHSGLSRRTLIEIEQGRTIGTLATWHALAHAFDVPFGDLLAGLCTGHRPPGTGSPEKGTGVEPASEKPGA